jgi:hypothetical protein
VSDEHDRPYSIPARPRNMSGEIAISCEYQEGRPCGDGAFGGVELDAAAGYGQLLTAATRLRLAGGSAPGADVFDVDRLYVKLDLDPFSLQIGRDVLALGPSVRSALMVSSNAAAQDGIRLRLAPVPLPFVPGIRFSAFYFIDRLRDPQTFHGTLLDLTQAQFDFWNRVQLGGSRSLQLGGDGAPDFGGFKGFVLEHFGRSAAPGAGEENNRLSLDVAVRIPELSAMRVYYQLVFEDTEKTFLNALEYDADHLLGLEVRKLDLGPVRRLFVEFEHTGVNSQEHSVFTTGMTNAGRTIGSALTPDGTSVWVRADLVLGPLQLSPWAEWLRFKSDVYNQTQERGVFVVSTGPQEHRQRLGADLLLPLAPGWRLEARAFGERIANTDLVPGSTTFGGGVQAAVVWTPE